MHYAIDVVTKIHLSRLFMNEWRIMGNVKDYALFRRISTSQIYVLKKFMRHTVHIYFLESFFLT